MTKGCKSLVPVPTLASKAKTPFGPLTIKMQIGEDRTRPTHLQNAIALNLESAFRSSLPKLNSNECAPRGTFQRKVALETCNLESASRCSEQRINQPLYLFNQNQAMPRGARIRKLEIVRMTSENDCQQPVVGYRPRAWDWLGAGITLRRTNVIGPCCYN